MADVIRAKPQIAARTMAQRERKKSWEGPISGQDREPKAETGL
ncbi:hypothetical protein [Bradyrhizobium iriomotense]|nr:hypothetical protein [Bradyrhizobium iriomotense]